MARDVWSMLDIGDWWDCWPYTGVLNSSGYGPHRRTFLAAGGYIPDGLELDHLCGNKPCCNPLHLEPVTPAENRRRRTAKITHCPQGHEYTPENTYVKNGSRNCRKCANRWAGLWHQRQRRKALYG